MFTPKRASNPSSVAQFPAQCPPQIELNTGLRIADLDGALRGLGDRGPGLALLVDGAGRVLDVVECAEPVPYRLSVEAGCGEADVEPCGWIA